MYGVPELRTRSRVTTYTNIEPFYLILSFFGYNPFFYMIRYVNKLSDAPVSPGNANIFVYPELNYPGCVLNIVFLKLFSLKGALALYTSINTLKKDRNYLYD